METLGIPPLQAFVRHQNIQVFKKVLSRTNPKYSDEG